MPVDIPIQVAIVEDDAEIRQTLSLIIHGTPGFDCRHAFDNCEDAVKELPELAVDVVLMDINLPGMTGIEGIKVLKPKMPETEFLMLTIQQDDESVFDSICAGASGYIVKDTPPTELLKSIKEAHEGGAPMTTSIARKVIHSFHQQPQESPLTDRETEILRLLCDGLNHKVISEQLFVSAHTVRAHIANIYKKLHVNSRAAAVREAIDKKLI